MHSRDLSFVREEAGEQRKRSNKFCLNWKAKNINMPVRVKVQTFPRVLYDQRLFFASFQLLGQSDGPLLVAESFWNLHLWETETNERSQYSG